MDYSIDKNLLQGLRDNDDAAFKYLYQTSFNKENSYFLKTSKLSGKGMASALGITRKIAKLANWDFQRNYFVHQVYHAEDFAFRIKRNGGIY